MISKLGFKANPVISYSLKEKLGPALSRKLNKKIEKSPATEISVQYYTNPAPGMRLYADIDREVKRGTGLRTVKLYNDIVSQPLENMQPNEVYNQIMKMYSDAQKKAKEGFDI